MVITASGRALVASIRANTAPLEWLGADSVPVIVVRHAQSGQTVTRADAFDTGARAQLVGLAAP